MSGHSQRVTKRARQFAALAVRNAVATSEQHGHADEIAFWNAIDDLISTRYRCVGEGASWADFEAYLLKRLSE